MAYIPPPPVIDNVSTVVAALSNNMSTALGFVTAGEANVLEPSNGATGNGTTDDSQGFVNANGMTGTAFVYVPSPTSVYRISQNVTITKPILIMPKGVSIDSGKVLTLNGPLSAGPYQIFSGAGTVAFGPGVVPAMLPEWWGASRSASAATNTAAFAAAAVAAVGAGVPVALQPGVAYAGALNLPSGAVDARVLAFGAKLLPAGTNTGLVAASPTDLQVYGLEIDGSNQNGTAHGGYVSAGTGVGFHGCHVHHCYQDALHFDGGTDLAVDGCHLHHAGNTQAVSGGSGSGVFAKGFTRLSVAGNHVHDCPTQFGQGVICQADAAANAWTEATITGNLIENCGGAFAGGGGIVVASSASNVLYRGTKATITGNTVNNSGDGGIWVNADEATVTGNVVNGTQVGWGIEVEDCRRVAVADNAVTGSHNDGIQVWQGSTPQQTMQRIALTGNVVEGSVAGNGIDVVGTIAQVALTGNTCCANHLSGILVGNTEQATVTGNTASGNGSSGIVVTTMADATVAGNSCFDNEQVATGVGGLRLYGVTHATVTGNRCGDTRAGGSKTQTYGIQLDNASDYLIVANNELQGNKTGALLNNTTTAHNALRGNGGYNPVSVVTSPAFPASNTTTTNTTGLDLTVYISLNGGTISQVQLPVGGAVGPTSGPFRVPAGGGIFIGTVTGSPTWVWVAD